MTEDQLMKLIQAELIRQRPAFHSDADSLVIDGPINLRELSKAILSSIDGQTERAG